MTKDEIMQLEGIALAEAVARDVMEWQQDARNETIWYTSGEGYRWICHEKCVSNPRSFRPDIDHNHAAEVRARMCELYGWRWEVVSAWEPIGPLTRVFYHSANQDGGWGLHGRNECVDTCHVALLAKAALG